MVTGLLFLAFRPDSTAASNLMALYEAVEEERVQRGDHVVLVAFGAGLTWGSILLQW